MIHTCPCGSPLETEDELRTGRCRGCRASGMNFSPKSWMDEMFTSPMGGEY